LSAVSGATSNNWPQARFLRETGKRLYPGTHPGVSTLLVGVFDFGNSLDQRTLKTGTEGARF
jgi:hypothetical protein